MQEKEKKLLLLLAVFLFLQFTVSFFQYLSETKDTRFGGDFIVFWQTGQQVAAKDTVAIYSKDKIDGKDVSRLIDNSAALPENKTAAPFAYPPHMLLLLWPLSYLEYNQAVFLWSAFSLGLFFWLLFWHFGFSAHDPKLRVVMASVMLPMLAANLFTGQTGTWIACLVLLAARFWQKSVPLGICLGVMTIKPQLIVLWPVALLVTGRWSVLAIAVATVAFMNACVTWWLGSAIWQEYLSAARYFSQYASSGFAWFAQLAVSPFISLRTAGVSMSIAIITQLVLSCMALIMVLKVFRNDHIVGEDKIALLAVASLLVTPYGLVYDSPILVLALMPFIIDIWEKGSRSLWEVGALVAVLAMPYAPPLLITYHLPFGLIALLSFAIVLLEQNVRYLRAQDKSV